MQATHGIQALTLTGIKFDASLGILKYELTKVQPISVDIELNMGQQPLQPDQDDIVSVLDYRAVRSLVIETCTSQHVNLLESLTGSLCLRLMALPGVKGVKAKIVKLKIFDDCEVAIKQQVGQW